MAPSARRQLVAATVLAALSQTAGMALKLDLWPVSLEDGGRVEFNQSACDPIAALPFLALHKGVVSKRLNHYEVLLRIEDVTVDPQRGFIQYLLYVRDRPPHNTITECVISGLPSGKFRAQFRVVTFSVESPDTATEVSTLQLPVLSFFSPPNLQGPRWSDGEAEDIEFSRTNEIFVPLENLSSAWPIRVTSVTSPKRGGGEWRRAEITTAGHGQFEPFHINPSMESNDLVVRLDPKPSHAFWRSLSSRSSPKTIDYFPISVQYVIEFGPTSIDQEPISLAIPVRLIPWPPLFLLALTVGTVLGSMVPLLSKRKRTDAVTHLKAFFAAFVVALLAWLLAIFLTQNNSEFRVGGVSLDPFQIPTAVIIGAVAGVLGFKSLDLVQKLIEVIMGRPPRPPIDESDDEADPVPRLPADHPLWRIRETTRDVLVDLQTRDSWAKQAQPLSIPVKRLLPTLLLQILYSIRSESILLEQLHYNQLYRWFVGLESDEPAWLPTVFAQDRARTFDAGIAGEFFAQVLEMDLLGRPAVAGYFVVDYMQLQAWASHKSVQAKTGESLPSEPMTAVGSPETSDSSDITPQRADRDASQQGPEPS